MLSCPPTAVASGSASPWSPPSAWSPAGCCAPPKTSDPTTVLGWDRHLESWIAGHRVSFLDPVFRWLTYLGTDGAIWLALAALVALSSRRWSILAWVALADVAAQVATGLIKLAVPRHRPAVHTLVKEPHGHSFPS